MDENSLLWFECKTSVTGSQMLNPQAVVLLFKGRRIFVQVA